MRINRNLVKALHRRGNTLEAYRFYVIARAAFARRSGLFSLNELCDLLHDEYGYRSLHRGPGNRRKVFRQKLYDCFCNSFLFQRTPDGRFITRSERRLLIESAGSDRSTWYLLPDTAILSSKGAFRDFCIGMLLAGNRFRSNQKTAVYCGLSVRRVQLATAANHRRQTFIKQFNFIEEKTGTKKEIEKERAMLFHLHGITSPRPLRRRGEWVLRLNAPNTYRSHVLNGVKGFHVQPPGRSGCREECWFVSLPSPGAALSTGQTEVQHWVFREQQYNLNNYLNDHSALLT